MSINIIIEKLGYGHLYLLFYARHFKHFLIHLSLTAKRKGKQIIIIIKKKKHNRTNCMYKVSIRK